MRVTSFAGRAGQIAHRVRERERPSPELDVEALAQAAVCALDGTVGVESVERREETARVAGEAAADGYPTLVDRLRRYVSAQPTVRDDLASRVTFDAIFGPCFARMQEQDG